MYGNRLARVVLGAMASVCFLKAVQPQRSPGCTYKAATTADCGPLTCPQSASANAVTLTLRDSSCGAMINRSDFQHLIHLQTLTIQNHTYQMVGDQAFYDTQLITLTIQQTTLTGFQPAALAGLSLLKTLRLTNNAISNLPNNLFQDLANLTFLFLSGNQLNYLPDRVFNGLSNLVVLDLSNNKISAFSPLVFRNLYKLITLRLSQNLLFSIPNNFLVGTPVGAFFVDKNQLTSISPQAFANSNVSNFKMDYNKLARFPKIAFQRMNKQITTIMLANNEIRRLAAGDVANLKIQNLDFSFNPLATVDPAAFSNSTINNLNLANTSLRTLPNTMESMLRNSSIKLNNVTSWRCDCSALWLAQILVTNPNNTSPTCSSHKLLIKSVQTIENICNRSTITAATTTTQSTLASAFTSTTSSNIPSSTYQNLTTTSSQTNNIASAFSSSSTSPGPASSSFTGTTWTTANLTFYPITQSVTNTDSTTRSTIQTSASSQGASGQSAATSAQISAASQGSTTFTPGIVSSVQTIQSTQGTSSSPSTVLISSSPSTVLISSSPSTVLISSSPSTVLISSPSAFSQGTSPFTTIPVSPTITSSQTMSSSASAVTSPEVITKPVTVSPSSLPETSSKGINGKDNNGESSENLGIIIGAAMGWVAAVCFLVLALSAIYFYRKIVRRQGRVPSKPEQDPPKLSNKKNTTESYQLSDVDRMGFWYYDRQLVKTPYKQYVYGPGLYSSFPM